jgi:hypothetical protein
MTPFPDCVNSWRRVLANGGLSDDAKRKIFAEAAEDIATYAVRGSVAKPDALDALAAIALTHSNFGAEQEVEGTIAAAFAHAEEEAERVPDEIRESREAKGNGAARPHALPLTFFDDLSDTPAPKPWLIKNVLARDETSSWIAPPGKGKSALFADIAVHAAGAGKDWRGYRIKKPTGVVYFALERADLTRRRLIAYKLRDGLESLPIAVSGQVIDLLNRNCVDSILTTIWEAEQRFACEVGLAIFDTYAKGIAAGGGDEDKAKDQNIVQANLRRLFDRGLPYPRCRRRTHRQGRKQRRAGLECPPRRRRRAGPNCGRFDQNRDRHKGERSARRRHDRLQARAVRLQP